MFTLIFQASDNRSAIFTHEEGNRTSYRSTIRIPGTSSSYTTADHATREAAFAFIFAA